MSDNNRTSEIRPGTWVERIGSPGLDPRPVYSVGPDWITLWLEHHESPRLPVDDYAPVRVTPSADLRGATPITRATHAGPLESKHSDIKLGSLNVSTSVDSDGTESVTIRHSGGIMRVAVRLNPAGERSDSETVSVNVHRSQGAHGEPGDVTEAYSTTVWCETPPGVPAQSDSGR